MTTCQGKHLKQVDSFSFWCSLITSFVCLIASNKPEGKKLKLNCKTACTNKSKVLVLPWKSAVIIYFAKWGALLREIAESSQNVADFLYETEKTDLGGKLACFINIKSELMLSTCLKVRSLARLLVSPEWTYSRKIYEKEHSRGCRFILPTTSTDSHWQIGFHVWSMPTYQRVFMMNYEIDSLVVTPSCV